MFKHIKNIIVPANNKRFIVLNYRVQNTQVSVFSQNTFFIIYYYYII